MRAWAPPLRATPRLRLGVIGAGYLGATHAACLAELGFEVLAVDNDPAKVEQLSRGIVPFVELGPGESSTEQVPHLVPDRG